MKNTRNHSFPTNMHVIIRAKITRYKIWYKLLENSLCVYYLLS